MLNFPLPPSLTKVTQDPRALLVTCDGQTLVPGTSDEPMDYILTDVEGTDANEDYEDGELAALEELHVEMEARTFKTGTRPTVLAIRYGVFEGNSMEGHIVWNVWVYVGEKYLEEPDEEEFDSEYRRCYFKHAWRRGTVVERLNDEGVWR